MTVRILVDTNVVIYTIDARAPEKMARARDWVRALARTSSLTISLQVLNEAHAVLRRKLKQTSEEAAAVLSPWRALCTAPLTIAETDLALAIERKWKTSWWDALLLASASAAECTHFLTEDTQSASKINDVTIVHPFRTTPAALLA